jgi:hypothetical protein
LLNHLMCLAACLDMRPGRPPTPSIAVLPIAAQATGPSALQGRAAPGSARGDAILPITDCLSSALPICIPTAPITAKSHPCRPPTSGPTGRWAGPPAIPLDRSAGDERTQPGPSCQVKLHLRPWQINVKF